MHDNPFYIYFKILCFLYGYPDHTCIYDPYPWWKPDLCLYRLWWDCWRTHHRYHPVHTAWSQCDQWLLHCMRKHAFIWWEWNAADFSRWYSGKQTKYITVNRVTFHVINTFELSSSCSIWVRGKQWKIVTGSDWTVVSIWWAVTLCVADTFATVPYFFSIFWCNECVQNILLWTNIHATNGTPFQIASVSPDNG